MKLETAASEMAAQAHHRLNTLLRAQRFYPPKQVIWLYKSLVLSYIETSTPAIFHATSFALSPLDRVQERFLAEMGLSMLDALSVFALAPLVTRRDMAMLGLIHRVVLGIAPRQFCEFIRPAASTQFPRALRAPHLRHDHQLHDPIDGSQANMYQRSLMGLVYSYNMLPQTVIDSKTVSSFQKRLQAGVLRAGRASI